MVPTKYGNPLLNHAFVWVCLISLVPHKAAAEVSERIHWWTGRSLSRWVAESLSLSMSLHVSCSSSLRVDSWHFTKLLKPQQVASQSQLSTSTCSACSESFCRCGHSCGHGRLDHNCHSWIWTLSQKMSKEFLLISRNWNQDEAVWSCMKLAETISTRLCRTAALNFWRYHLRSDAGRMSIWRSPDLDWLHPSRLIRPQSGRSKTEL